LHPAKIVDLWYILGMVLRVPISAEARLSVKAKAAGVDLSTYVARYLEMVIQPSRSLREISGPIAEAFKASGMTEGELGDLLEEEKHAMRAERHINKAQRPQ
jgi:hypothetical protein